MAKKLGSGLSRREFLKLGGAGLAGAALMGSAACGGGGGSDSGELIISFGPDDTGTLPKLIKQFNKSGAGFKVKQRVMPSDTGQYFDKLRTEFQAGGGDIDIIIGDVIWPAQFAVNGWVTDLSDRFKDSDDFLPGPMRAATYQGKIYAVPWYTDAGLLYYRQDLLDKAGFSGPPETWDDLMEMGEKIQKDEGIKNGFVYQGADYEGGVCNGLEYIRTNGGDVLDPNDPTKVIIDSEGTVNGLAVWRETIQNGVSPQAVLQYQEDESAASFLNGESVFIRNWPYMYALAGTPDYPELDKGQLGIAPIPVDEPGNPSSSTLGGWNYLINATSDSQDEAWEFIKWITDPAQLITNAELGSKLPTRQALYDDPEVLEKVPVAKLGKDAIIQNSTPRPVSPYYSDVSLELSEQFNQCLAGNVSPDNAASNLQSNLQEIIDQGEQAAG